MNEPYARILELLGEASIGVNTMVDEHFGINVVEFMVRPPLLDRRNFMADGRFPLTTI